MLDSLAYKIIYCSAYFFPLEKAFIFRVHHCFYKCVYFFSCLALATFKVDSPHFFPSLFLNIFYKVDERKIKASSYIQLFTLSMSIAPNTLKAQSPSVTWDSSADYGIHFLLCFRHPHLYLQFYKREFKYRWLKDSFSGRIVWKMGEKENVPVGSIHDKEEQMVFQLTDGL